MAARARALAILAVVAVAAGACGDAAASFAPEEAVVIENPTDEQYAIEYERPDGATERLLEVQPGQQLVVGQIFEGREGLCRTGRLVARDDAGAEFDELYLVCKGQRWVIGEPVPEV